MPLCTSSVIAVATQFVIMNTPMKITNIVKILDPSVVGVTSPYPIVVIVTVIK